MVIQLNNYLKNTLYGFIIGDALGVPYEFNQRNLNIKKLIMTSGTYQQLPGTWSDDSSMLLCTLKNIIYDESLDQLMSDFINFYLNGYMTPHGECFDIGVTTQQALENKIYLHKSTLDCGLTSVNSNGNGALMRILAILPLLKNDDIHQNYLIVKKYSQLTHNHEISHQGCLLYCLILKFILQYPNCTNDDLIYFIIKLKYQFDWLEQYYHIFNSHFKDQDISTINSDGYIVHTLDSVLWTFLNYDKFNDSILQIIKLGFDTDTNAALLGALKGATGKYNTEINNWIPYLQNLKLIKSIINPYLKKFEGDYSYD